MSRLRMVLALGALLAASVLLVACTAPVTPTPAPTGAPTAAAPASPTAAPAPTATRPPAAASPTPAASPSPTGARVTPTVTSTTAGCPAQVVRGFGLVYNREPAVAQKLGCPISPEVGIEMTLQRFQNGMMVQWAGSPDIVVLRSNGSWSSHPNTWRAGEALPPVETPPAGAVVPQEGFGKLWAGTPEIKQALGWPTAPQERVTGAIQGFANGRMLWTPDKQIYVLYEDHTWQRFADEFTG